MCADKKVYFTNESDGKKCEKYAAYFICEKMPFKEPNEL